MNRKLGGLSLFLVAAIYSGCDDREESRIGETSTRLFSLTVDPSYNTSKSEDWIIIQDEAGETLASQSFESDQNIILETNENVSTSIGITFLKITAARGEDYFLLKSYLNVEKGKTALLRTKTPSSAGKNIGIFDVILDGISSPDQFSLSTKHGMLYSGGRANNKLNLKGFLYSSSSDYLLQVTDVSENPRFKMLKGVKPNETYSLNFDELDSFDKIVEFSFPECNQVNLSVKARRPDQSFNDPGYTLNNHFIADYHSKIKAGYLDELTNYETELTLNYTDHGYVYKNIGSIPDASINWPSKSSFKILESRVENFSAKATAPFIWRQSAWHLKNSDITRPDKIVWDVFSLSPVQHFTNLPDEILFTHPTLSFENLEYAGTTFYTQSEPYTGHVDKILNDSEKSPAEPQVGIMIY